MSWNSDPRPVESARHGPSRNPATAAPTHFSQTLIEPIFEADFLPCSYGFRPKRSAHDALQVVIEEAWGGRRWVVETDIASCYEAIPKTGLVRAMEARICDQSMLKLLRAMLNAGVMEAERALTRLGSVLGAMGLELKDSKTRIVHLEEGGDGFDFLGFHHRWVRAYRARHIAFLARWPSRKAMQQARERIREETDRSRLANPMTETVATINRIPRGWTGYFRCGNSTQAFQAIRVYALDRVAQLLAKRHKQHPQWGRRVLFCRTPDQLGVMPLRGIVVAPRPGRPWRQGS